MKILITGAKGMLGTDLVALLKKQHEIVETDIQELDITDLAQVLHYTKKIKPDIIINPAAYTNVDNCEKEIDLAFMVNAVGPKNIAIAANEVNASVMHISTEYIFDGETKQAYKEWDLPNPLSVYGKSKLDGENFVKSIASKYYIVRTQSLYGENGPNFVKTIIKAAKERGQLKVVNDQFSSPTFTKDLSFGISQLIEKPDYGVYHITNSEVVSWYEFTKEILEQANITGVKLEPCTAEEYPRPAKRPKYAPLDNFYFRLGGYKVLRTYKEALQEFLKL